MRIPNFEIFCFFIICYISENRITKPKRFFIFSFETNGARLKLSAFTRYQLKQGKMHGLGTWVCLLLFMIQSTQAARFDIKGDQNAIDTSRIDQNIVIINLKKYNKRTEFVFTCSCDGQNCLDLNYTFISHETILERV
jgi:hypothetical protein